MKRENKNEVYCQWSWQWEVENILNERKVWEVIKYLVH